jgi:SAM-dependent methyltransferase
MLEALNLPGFALKRYIPWWGKIAAKVILSRLPLDYRAYASAGLFRHGKMDQDDYALRVLQWHLTQAGLTDLQGLVCLELGPGDAVSSALVAHALGAKRCYLIDVGAFASEDMNLYHAQARALEQAGYPLVDISTCTDVQALLNRVNGVYLTDGLASLRSMGTDSIDFAWSQAVLEHVRLEQFDQTLAELHRALKPSGVSSHRIDLQDHLAGSLHNLRFRRATWERDWFAGSGFYTNRIRHEDMVSRLKAAGFGVKVTAVDRWQQLPLAKDKLDREFADLPDDELRVSGFDVVLRP